MKYRNYPLPSVTGLLVGLLMLFPISTVHAGKGGLGQPYPGSLDATFNQSGKVVSSFTLNDYYTEGGAYASAQQTDGKLVLAGDNRLARYNSDGSPDLGFGSGGVVTTGFGVMEQGARGLAIQSDGKIVLAGGAGNAGTFRLERYNANGTLDPGFGNNGVVVTALTAYIYSYAGAFALALQDDGKLVAGGAAITYLSCSSGGFGGCTNRHNFALARYNPDGSLDPAFGTNGTVIVPNSSNEIASRIHGLAIQGDGSIVAAGYSEYYDDQPPSLRTNVDFAVMRFTPAGAADSSFGGGAKVTTDFGGPLSSGRDRANKLKILSDGRILLAGTAYTSHETREDVALARYNPDGSLDTAFGTSGKVTTDFAASSDSATGLAIQSDGKIVTGGSRDLGTYYDNKKRAYVTRKTFAVLRYSPDGSLDDTFGPGGKVSTAFNNNDTAYDLLIQSDGKIVLAGGTKSSDGFHRMAAARYLP